MKAFRIGVTAVSIVFTQAIICGVAIAPAVFVWSAVVRATPADSVVRLLVASMLLAPSYMLFALCLMPVSALITRLAGARTPPCVELRISDMSWTLMTWAQYMAASHVVRLVAGTVFRGSPIWTAYLRMNGARIGRRVYINTLSIADHNLLEFGDDVIVGADVHISGHTVEAGMLKTAGVRLGSNVTIGLGSVIDIDVEVGPHCQVGALTLVPKHARLEGHAAYVGIPARRITGRVSPGIGGGPDDRLELTHVDRLGDDAVGPELLGPGRHILGP
jgi:acetyltransferase-like isoleucine patch superfamily enzyme